MAERSTKQRTSRFWTGAALYALAALTLIGVGLYFFWDFLSAYEASRLRNTVNEYMETLNVQHVVELGEEKLLSQVDGRLRDKEDQRGKLLAALQGDFTCAKNVSKSTEDTQVYALRLGARVIGSFRMEQTGEPSWGFAPWSVTGEEVDLSFLLGEPVSVTVPADYTVFVNGIPLSADCVVQEEIPYAELDEFADSYTLPTMVRYEAGPLVGEAAVSLTDGAGTPVDPQADSQVFLDNCSQAEREQVKAAVRSFVQAYVDYTSCKGGAPAERLEELVLLMVPRGELAQRMRGALDGLTWVTDRRASVSELEVSLISRVDEALYFCDIHYTVNTRNHTGNIQAENHVKLIFRRSGSRLLAEAMVVC